MMKLTKKAFTTNIIPHYLRFKEKTFNYLSKFKNGYQENTFEIYNDKTLSHANKFKTIENFFNVKFKNKKQAIQFIKGKIKYKKSKNAESFIYPN